MLLLLVLPLTAAADFYRVSLDGSKVEDEDESPPEVGAVD
jgi:hypothetical protein